MVPKSKHVLDGAEEKICVPQFGCVCEWYYKIFGIVQTLYYGCHHQPTTLNNNNNQKTTTSFAAVLHWEQSKKAKTQQSNNRKISMIFPLVSCCSCVNNPSSS